MGTELFTKKMRKATREQHALSDALVNAKLAFAMSDNGVWSEGLLIFYEIFRYLENVLKSSSNKNLRELYIEGMDRTEAFEEDLDHYLGDWRKDYSVRESVANYLLHLKNLEENDSDLLMAYVYHLYMGLFSGGQILRKKRSLQNKLLFHKNDDIWDDHVTDFGEHKIHELKNNLVNSMNVIAENLTDDKKLLLIEESKKVFELNNSIIKTVKNTNKILAQKLILVSFLLVLFYLVYRFLRTIYSY